MSFSFGFRSADFSDDELGEFDSEIQQNTSLSGSTPASYLQSNPLDAAHLLDNSVVQPQLEDLQTISKSLENVRVSFEEFRTPHQGCVLYRRELFDVKHQLMSEAGNDDDELELDILMGETSEDLRKNVYEGGLKSWECSIDVVDSLAESTTLLQGIDCILELGCGTALPTEHIFSRYLLEGLRSGLNLILSDYNKSVLRLVTIPNLIITWAKTVLTFEQWTKLQQCDDDSIPIKDDELLLTPRLLETFCQDMKSRNLLITIVSGTWGRSFTNLISSRLSSDRGILVITSETIYQPDNLPVIAETLLEVILSSKPTKVKALVAAKDIYFGVGGSIMEFERYLNERIQSNSLPVSFHTYKIDAGLKRSIVSIE